MHKVYVVGSRYCPACTELLRWLPENSVDEFVEVEYLDVYKDHKTIRELERRSNTDVRIIPTMFHGGKAFHGREEIKPQLLHLCGENPAWQD